MNFVADLSVMTVPFILPTPLFRREFRRKRHSRNDRSEERRAVGKINVTAITNRLQNSFKITCTDHRIIEI
jgi:hypothetical protein